MNTPDTTPSGNIHGMPMACLLGHGPRSLTHVLRDASSKQPHLKVRRSFAFVLCVLFVVSMCISKASQCVFIGIRDVDATELPLVRDCVCVCDVLCDG
jgi:arginase family enzyme